MPTPARASTTRTAPSGSRRRVNAVTAASRLTAARLPIPMPATRATAPLVVAATPATEAPANSAAHEAIVHGFDAVAPSDVTNARHGPATSRSVSPPARTRHALHSVRTPSTASTTAPQTPRIVRRLLIDSTGAAPAAPATA